MKLIHTLKFIIPGIPKARNSMRVSVVTDKRDLPVKDINGKYKIAKFQSKESTNDSAYIKWSFVQQRPHGWKPWAGPVSVEQLHYIFPHTIESRRKGNNIKISKPDLQDNLNKITFDALKGIIIADDCLIFRMNDVLKCYGDEPGIYLMLGLYEV